MKIYKSFAYCLILATIILSGCRHNTEKIIREKFPDGKTKQVIFVNKDEDAKNSYKQNSFYPDGKLQSEGALKNGKMDGKWIYYYQNGKKWSEGYFKEGLEEGLRTAYYDNSQKRYEGEFKDGKKIGTWKFWDDKGKPAQTVKF